MSVSMYSHDHVCLSACADVAFHSKRYVLHLCASTDSASVAGLAEAPVHCSLMQDLGAVCALGEQQVYS